MKLRFNLDLQLFASHKGVGSTRNGRDSAGRRLGAKLGDGQICKAGAIIYRQRGTKINAGINTKRGNDDTIFALKAGVVKYERVGKDKKRVSVYEVIE
ncbi:MAG TPA: 50S ribosomal protein L27 [Candidatus Onthovivens sp.]|nr:50S ribosomal protein L27 [Candidatus Onthovivens sp.]